MDFLSRIPSTVLASQSVAYSCTLTNIWSGATHPILYDTISGNAHWSPPVLVAHNADYTLWAPNTLASPGVEDVAEMGSTQDLEKEIEEAQDKGTAGDSVVGTNQFNNRNSPQTLDTIAMTPDFSLLSAITMVAPSPDWFSGIYNVDLIDRTTGSGSNVWYESFEIATYPWDAGTEQGDTYTINNNPEAEHRPIARLTKDTVPDNGILLNPDGTEVLPMAIVACTLVGSSCSDSEELRFRNRRRRNCKWVARKKTNKRCNKMWNGKPLSSYCPETCGNCD